MVRAYRSVFAFVGAVSALTIGTMGCSRRRDSLQVVAEVQNRMRADDQLTMGRFQVTGINGIVTLAGYVLSNHQRAAAVRDAWQVRGVKVVVDNIRIVDSSRINLSLGVPKPSESLQNDTPHPKPPTVTPPSVASRISPIENSPGPALPETSTSSSPKSTFPPGAVLVPGVNVRLDGPTSAALSAATTRPSAPERIMVPYGTLLVVRLTESLSSDINEKGDTFLASLASPILQGNKVVVPEGAGIKGRVVEVQSAGRWGGRPVMIIEVTRLAYNGKSYDLRSSQYSRVGLSRNVRTAATIGGGSGIGAILGGIFGGGRGAVIGAMLGAGAGTGVRAASRGAMVRLPAESTLNFRLQADLTVTPASTLQRRKNFDPDALSDDDRPVLKRRPDSASPGAATR